MRLDCNECANNRQLMCELAISGRVVINMGMCRETLFDAIVFG